MNKFGFKFLLFFICLMFTANTSLAWDAVGHKLTTHIAWERMTPEVRQKVIKILLDAPEDSDLSVHYDAFDSRSTAIKERELFMYASIWSDVIRNRNFDVRYKKYHQGDWHYADIFWKQENGIAKIIADFPEESGKAIPKLTDFEQILRNSSYKNEEKAIALAWFLHVGGDIHNPLHNASRITENSPKGDQGGNRFILKERTDKQRGINLHGYWDSIIGNVKPRKNDACDSDYLAPIARRLMKKYPYSKMQNRLKLGNYKAWNVEGFEYLDKAVYQDITRNQMPSKKYRQRTYNIASEQITLAGYRLGEMLNEIFSQDTVMAEKPDKEAKVKTEISSKDAIIIWNKIKTVIDNEQTFKFIKVDIQNTTVILNGIIANENIKEQAVKAIANVEGVTKVINNLMVDESITDQPVDNELKPSQTIPSKNIQSPRTECQIIRKVLYPVSKRRTPEQTLRLALLDICPPNKGMVARPMITIFIDGEPVWYEYDVKRVFETETEARKYAQDNKITDVNY